MINHYRVCLLVIMLVPAFVFAGLPQQSAMAPHGVSVELNRIDTQKCLVKYHTTANASDIWKDEVCIPVITRFVALNEGEDLNYREVERTTRISDLNVQFLSPEMDIPSISNAIEVGEGWSHNGFRLVPVMFHPLVKDPATDDFHIVQEIEIEIDHSGDPEIMRRMRRSLRRCLGGLLINNPPHRDDQEVAGGYVYVIPNDNDVRELMQDLYEWRRRQGFNVREITVFQGARAEDMRREIRRMHGDNFPIEYICLVGDAGGEYSVPTFMNGTSDYVYGLLSEDSPLPDAAVGRISYNSLRELQRIIDKIIVYEQQPDRQDVEWYRRGSVAAGSERSGFSTILLGRWVRDLMLNRGFTEVDTFWYTMGVGVEDFMQRVFDRGTAFVNYRGWTGLEDWSTREAGLLNNDHLPVALLLGCNTGDYEGVGAGYTEALLRASGGSIGAIGSAGSQSRVSYNNALMAGYYRGVLEDGIVRLGWTLNRAKIEMYAAYGIGRQDRVHGQALMTNLMGDPGTVVWRGTPRAVELDAPNQVLVGSDAINIQVTSEGQPVSGTRVGLYKERQITSTAFTDEEGRASIFYNPLNVTAGTAWVTVSGDRIVPVSRPLQFERPNRMVLYQSHFIFDDDMNPRQGNGDGFPNPFEVIELSAINRNIGIGPIQNGVRFTLTSNDDAVDIIQNFFNHPQFVNPGAVIIAPFLVRLNNNFPHRSPVEFELTAVAEEEEWISTLSLIGVAPNLDVTQVEGEFDLIPGAELTFDIWLTNNGGVNFGTSDAFLVSLDVRVEVIAAEAVYDPIAVGDTLWAGDVYTIFINADVPYGSILPFELELIDDNNYEEVTSFSIEMDPPPPTITTGPDDYGYWAIDDDDNQSNLMPFFNWIELNPRLGGEGHDTGLLDRGEDQDQSVVLPLPFAFVYYGQEYDELTVSTNGWAAFGDQRAYVDFRNMQIGSPQGPVAQLCPWWDDLYQPGVAGGVFYAYYPDRRQFVVEWYRMRRWIGLPGPGASETFEIILHDPQWYPTYTGDGDIVFQYLNVTHEARVDAHGTPYATIGIGSPDDRGGIQYGFWNTWAPGASAVGNGSAIRFATAEQHVYGEVSGVVRDLENDEPIAGAIVRCSTGGWDTTDVEGRYQILNVLAGIPTTVISTADGYNDEVSRQFNLIPGNPLEINLMMRHPEIAVDIEQIVDSLDAGREVQHRFNIDNDGNGELEFGIVFSLHEDERIALKYPSTCDDLDDVDDLWDILFQWSVSDSIDDQRILGVAYTSEGFYVTGGNNGEVTNYIYRFDRQGRLTDRIIQPCEALWGMHDLAWDGQNLYGGCGDLIYVMDQNGDVLDEIYSPLNPPRGLAVDPVSGEIWIANDGDPIHRLSADGELIATYPHRLRPYGLAWHTDDPDDCPLYIFSADGETNLAISKMNIQTGDVKQAAVLELEEGDRAGGFELVLNWDTRRWTMVSVIQNSNGDRIALFDAGPNLAWLTVDPENGVVLSQAQQECTLTISAEQLEGQDYSADMVILHNAAGEEIRIPITLNVDPEVALVSDDTPVGYGLSDIYPNPSNGISIVRFSLPRSGYVRLAIWDNAGRLVTNILDERLPAGSYQETFAAADLPSGIYFVRLESVGGITIRKFALLK